MRDYGTHPKFVQFQVVMEEFAHAQHEASGTDEDAETATPMTVIYALDEHGEIWDICLDVDDDVWTKLGQHLDTPRKTNVT